MGWQTALYLLAQKNAAMPLKDIRALYHAAIRACATEGQWERAVEVLDSMRQFSPAAKSYKVVIHACESASTVLRLHDVMVKDKVHRDASVFTKVISSLGKTQWQTALSLLDGMRGKRGSPDVATYNSVITACARNHEWESAIAVLRLMQCARRLPDIISYTACISACTRFKISWQLWEEMHRKRVSPNIVAYNAILNACTKGRDVNNAYIMWQKAWAIFHTLGNVSPNNITYCTLMSVCEKAAMWQSALDVLHLMPDTPPLIAYNAAISACEKGRKWEHAMNLLNDMPKHVEPDVISYNAAISACEKSGQWQYALSLLDRMRSSRITPNIVTVSACLSACEKAAQWQRAVLLFEKDAQALGPTTIAYNTYILALSRSHMWERALDVMTRMYSDTRVEFDAISFISCPHISLSPFFVRVAQRLAGRWARRTRSFIKGPKEAVQLLQILGASAPRTYTRAVHSWIFVRTINALRAGDEGTLSRFALPHLGPFTREALDALGIGTFDASTARRTVAAGVYTGEALDALGIGTFDATARRTVAASVYTGVKAKHVVAHISVGHKSEIVRYAEYADGTLSHVHLGHDRVEHAERKALSRFIGATEEVRLYITHRPCLSCIAAMVSFQKLSPQATLLVAFDELDSG